MVHESRITKRKRCPKGEHFDKTSGKCTTIKNKNSFMKMIGLDTLFESTNASNISNPTSSKDVPPTVEPADKRKRCPKGEHFDKPSGKCISKQTRVKRIKQIKSNKTHKIQLVLNTQEGTSSPTNDISTSPIIENPKMITERPLIENSELLENAQENNPRENIHYEISEFPEMPVPATINEESLTENNALLENEKREYESITEPDILYPDLNDQDFSYKIASKNEFSDTKYDGSLNPIKQKADEMCQADFELMPHQVFVKNFLSYQTPYNSLLLYHGLGSGKTCSAIGVAEEMRAYMKNTSEVKTILVIASPNVQDNFRVQLFNESKLKEEGGVWNLNVCIGNTLLNEINPTSIIGLSRERIISQINTIIRRSYEFMGYSEFANYINRKISVPDNSGYEEQMKKKMILNNIKKYFNNRLVIIDEIHNLTLADNKQKATSQLLHMIAKYSENMRLLLLSATPMYNSHTEIVWLANLMNINDKRATITNSDIFTKDGLFKTISSEEKDQGKEDGKELLKRKLTGYISYVRGENPYTFPYRVYPSSFAPERSLTSNKYPQQQMNQKTIEEPLSYIPVYLNEIGEYQEKAYQLMVHSFEKNMTSFETMEGFGYTILLGPLASLIIVYPNEVLDQMIQQYQSGENKIGENHANKISEFIGESGLNSIMTYTEEASTKENPIPLRHSFKYKPEILKRYGPIFKPEYMHKYSRKIAEICSCIQKSTGIVLIYSQFIDGGAVPMALALEEIGLSRFSTGYHKNLFKKPPTELVDAITMKPKTKHLIDPENGDFRPAKYMMITGHKEFSPDNYSDINYLTNTENINGEKVKVVIISKAGAEGLDFKYIRQIHILEPWYNMNRIEQIIGRGVRNGSHCKLPFEQRNVEIYLHASLTSSGEEAADLYVYRLAERKAIKIGYVTRLLKEVAVDCILNISQTNFTEDKLYSLVENQNIQIHLSNGRRIPYKIGDKPYTDICDYMEECFNKCAINRPLPIVETDMSTYNDEFMKTSIITLMKRIRDLFREKSIYHIKELITAINISKTYPEQQIYYALTRFIENKSEVLIDKYTRSGYMINRGEYYLFQPNEITDENASVYERIVPVDYKREKLLLELPPEGMVLKKNVNTEEAEITADHIFRNIIKSVSLVFQKRQLLKGSERDWYLHANNVLDELKKYIPEESIMKYIIYHILDILPYKEKRIILSYFYKKESLEIPTDSMIFIQQYFDEKIMQVRNTKGIVLADEKELVFLIQSLDDASIWEKAKSEDINRIQTELKKWVIPYETMFPLVGFIHLFNPNIGMVFKLKTMSMVKQNKNNKGARADQAPKPDLVNKLNMVLEFEEDEYAMNNANTISLRTIGISVMIELIMRYKTEKEDANMFFSPEFALVNRIVDL
jgi:superfamily II DNA or RNA helicase